MAFLTFGSGSRLYTFPGATLHTSSDNFADAVLRADKLPGLSGGYDVFGRRAAPTDVGQVQLGFTLVAASRDAMTAKRDAVRAMQDWGVRRLTKQPTDPADPPRFCWARVRSVGMPERHGEHTDLHQPVTLVFQVTDPRWQSQAGLWWLDEGEILDGGLDLGGLDLGAITSGDTLTLTNDGNTVTPVRLEFSLASGGSLTSLRLRHTDDEGLLRTDCTWAGTLVAHESLVLDSHSYRVTRRSLVGDVPAYANLAATDGGLAFIVLQPGANTLLVTGTFTNLSATAEFIDGWR